MSVSVVAVERTTPVEDFHLSNLKDSAKIIRRDRKGSK